MVSNKELSREIESGASWVWQEPATIILPTETPPHNPKYVKTIPVRGESDLLIVEKDNAVEVAHDLELNERSLLSTYKSATIASPEQWIFRERSTTGSNKFTREGIRLNAISMLARMAFYHPDYLINKGSSMATDQQFEFLRFCQAILSEPKADS